MSTSGNSANILHAAAAAKARGMKVVAMTGAKGGKLADLADVAIRAPEKRTCHVQELHLPIYHCLCLMLEDAFFGG
jgi:D-sedoheptulose 7-phosphate isomerase